MNRVPIYDTTYRRIEGLRNAGRFRFLPIAAVGLRLAFRRKLPKILLLLSLIPFAVMMVFLCGPHLAPDIVPWDELGPQANAVIHFSATGLYMFTAQFEWFFLFVLTMLCGSGLIANDLRANALEIYFSRPLTLTDYFLGKLLVILSVLIGLTLIPCLLLWLTDVTITAMDGYWIGQLHLLPRMIGACLVVALPYAVLMLAISSIARTARNSMLLFAGVVLLSKLLSRILEETLREPLYGLISLDRSVARMVDLVAAPDRDLVEMTSPFGPVPLLELPAFYPALVVGGVMLVSLLVFFRRVRGIEVVAGS